MAMAVYDHIVILQYRSTIIQYLKKSGLAHARVRRILTPGLMCELIYLKIFGGFFRRLDDSWLAAPMVFTDVPQCGIFQRIAREGEIYEKTRPYSDNCRAFGRSRYRLVLCGTGKNHGSADWRRFRALVSLPYMRE